MPAYKRFDNFTVKDRLATEKICQWLQGFLLETANNRPVKKVLRIKCLVCLRDWQSSDHRCNTGPNWTPANYAWHHVTFPERLQYPKVKFAESCPAREHQSSLTIGMPRLRKKLKLALYTHQIWTSLVNNFDTLNDFIDVLFDCALRT